MIDISKLDRAEVLAALFNASKPQGMGFVQNYAPVMTTEEARRLLGEYDYFDYVRGRVMKISLRAGAEQLDPRLYDRDNGEGAAERAIAHLRGLN